MLPEVTTYVPFVSGDGQATCGICNASRITRNTGECMVGDACILTVYFENNIDGELSDAHGKFSSNVSNFTRRALDVEFTRTSHLRASKRPQRALLGTSFLDGS